MFEEARKAGFVRVRVNGEVRDLSESFDLDKQRWHTIEIVVDRLVVGDSAERGRVADSVETALRMADGTVLVADTDGNETLFSELFACVHCNISLGELEPRTFSFNNPHGACATCTGIGYRLEVDPDLVMPDRSLSLDEGAVQPWARSGSSSPWLSSLMSSVARAHRFSTRTPVGKLSKRHLDVILYGTGGKPVRMSHRTKKGKTYEWSTSFEGVVNNLARRHRETQSSYMRSEIERYMASRPCQSCAGQRLKPEALAVRVCGLNIMQVTDKSIGQALEWVRQIGGDASSNGRSAGVLTPRQKAIGAQILKEIEGASALPAEHRARLPDPVADRLHSERRRGPAHPAGDADRLRPDRRAVRLRRALDRAAPRPTTTVSSRR